MPAPWVIDGHGQPSDDPAVLFKEPKGPFFRWAASDSGHKGYGLSLLVEALTGGLAGHGRADAREGWGATVFLQVIDPRAFAGPGCVHAADRRGGAAVPCIAPGARRLARSHAGREGVGAGGTAARGGYRYHRLIMPALEPWARKLGVAMP